MKRKGYERIELALVVGLFVGWVSGCTPEVQASVADALASSADAAISALLTFAVDFSRQVLAAFLY
jgi:hypothetical protein